MTTIPVSRLSFRPEGAVDLAKLEKGLLHKLGRAIRDFDLIGEGDRIMVCISGGKDSYALLDLLMILQRRAPVSFELLVVNIDQGWPGYRTDLIEKHVKERGVPYRMISEDYAKIVEAKIAPGGTPCSLCSRFRRGVLYRLSDELSCTKIALGHHLDDVIETLAMNMFYSGRLAAMPAKLVSDSGRNVVIRPMVCIPEARLSAYSEAKQFPVVACGCPSCGLPEQKRQRVKRLLAELEAESPGLKHNMFAAIGNVAPSHLLDESLSRGPG